MRLRRGLEILEDLVDGWQVHDIPSEEYLRRIVSLSGLTFNVVLAIAKKKFGRPTAPDRDADAEFIRAIKDAIRIKQTIEQEEQYRNQATAGDAE